ncbi:TPA: phage tail tape measure protein [Morganella morganii]
MAGQIADLVINLSADSKSFTEQMGRVERQLLKVAADAVHTEESISRMAEGQSLAVRQAADSTQAVLKALDASQIFSAENFVRKWREVAQDIESTHQKINDKISNNRQQIQSTRALEKQQDELTAAFYRQIDAVKKVSDGMEKLAQIRIRLDQSRRSGALSQQNHQALLSATRERVSALRRETEGLSQQRIRFIQRLKEQVAVQNLSQGAMLRFQAAQLGIRSSAEIYIRQLKGMSTKTEELKNSSGFLAEGMNRLAGHFGLSGIVAGGAWGAALTVITGIGKAAWQAEQEFTQFNKQLTLTGNYANKTASQLNEMARTLSGGGITQNQMADTIAKVTGSGYFRDNELTRVSKAAAQLNYITGQSVETTINQFKRLQDEPLQVSLELEKSNHHLTAAQLEQIRTLELQGNKTAAARLAIDAYVQSINDGTTEISNNLGHLESAWVTLRNIAASAWDAMLGEGRTKTLDEQIRKTENKIKLIGNVAPEYRMKQLKEELESLKEQKFNEDLEKARIRADKNNEQIEVNRLGIKQKHFLKNASWEERQNFELAELEKDRWALTDEEYEGAQRRIIHRNRPRDQTKGKEFKVDQGTKAEEQAIKEQAALESKLRVLKEHQSVTDVISAERKKLWETEAQIATIEEAVSQRQLTEQEQALLANKAAVLVQHEKLALLGDEVVAQERLNKLRDQADKYVKQQTEQQNAIRDSIGKSSREAQQVQERSQILSAHQDSPRLNDMLAAQADTYSAEEEKRANWLAGAQTAWGDYRDAALDSNAQIKNAASQTLEGLSSELTSVLTTGKANFREFTTSVLKMLTDIFVKKSLVMTLEATGFGGLFPNANGGVYHSSSLSAYSGQVVHTPTMFAFAHGAGLMGEAGPEGIFPLHRGLDGKLGVAAKLSGHSGNIMQHNNITINNDGNNGQIGPQATRRLLELVEQKTKQVLITERRPGGTFGA